MALVCGVRVSRSDNIHTDVLRVAITYVERHASPNSPALSRLQALRVVSCAPSGQRTNRKLNAKARTVDDGASEARQAGSSAAEARTATLAVLCDGADGGGGGWRQCAVGVSGGRGGLDGWRHCGLRGGGRRRRYAARSTGVQRRSRDHVARHGLRLIGVDVEVDAGVAVAVRARE